MIIMMIVSMTKLRFRSRRSTTLILQGHGNPEGYNYTRMAMRATVRETWCKN